ncbi:MAG: bifunctional folylpolyglutamate synthase/dihydrofolate synthase [Labilithrix sp.]|nr:bifunctional folylpolyglutamate synthase/dihydrofolate synthase [Labilithrix sp.]MCW5814759.1 bifunctional folylpolyglutamate synthase/dihydrofolate synthase [Labilithrix sp.]
MRLGLDAMREACAATAHPERAFPSVHVAGTNGKGSTCAMVESIARAAGLKTGLYTSPHLVRFAERIRIDGEPIDDASLAVVLDEALRHDISFFETATLAAFLAFRAAKVDLAIIEVGIGGRLDATNVLPADTVRASAITGIALDHQDKLGDTLAEIAREKGGIARPGVPLVHGPLPAEAFAAIQAAGAPLVEAPPYDDPIGLAGPHQRSNAGVAAELGRLLTLTPAAISHGIATTSWPGRLERIATPKGSFILDGAHNADGAAALVAALRGEPIGAVVFGALADKPWRAMLAHVAELDAPRFYVSPAGRAPAAPAELAALYPGTPSASLHDAVAAACASARGLPVVVCGSLYLVGEARARILDLERDPSVAL